MTDEQIAELRRLHHGTIAQDTGWAQRHGQPIYAENVAFMVACNNALTRLLAERDAMLLTLEGIRKRARSAASTREYEYIEEDCDAAIAKAKAP